MKRIQVITWDETGLVQTIEYPKIGKKVVNDYRKFSPAIRAATFMHGGDARFGDLESADKVGHAKFERASKLSEHYATGTDEWTLRGERDTVSAVIEVMASLKPQEWNKEMLEAAAEFDKDQVSKWREIPEVKLELHQRRLRKLQEDLADKKPEPLKINLPKSHKVK